MLVTSPEASGDSGSVSCEYLEEEEEEERAAEKLGTVEEAAADQQVRSLLRREVGAHPGHFTRTGPLHGGRERRCHRSSGVIWLWCGHFLWCGHLQ